jgi:hypothetical protein
MKMRVLGIVREKESGEPVAGLIVHAYDKDLISDDLLGKAQTGSDGKFLIEYDSEDFKDGLDRNPDIYVEVFLGVHIKDKKKGKVKPIYSTKKSVRHGASSSEKFYIEITKKKLG